MQDLIIVLFGDISFYNFEVMSGPVFLHHIWLVALWSMFQLDAHLKWWGPVKLSGIKILPKK